MGTIRYLLNRLDRDALVRLRHLRGLRGGDNNDERRETLARSYRGDVDELIQQLDHGELVTIFDAVCFVISGERMHLPDAEKYGVDDLRRFARKAFAGARLRGPSPFHLLDGGEEDDGAEESEDEEEDEAGESEDEELGDEDDSEADEESEEDEEDAASNAALESLRQKLSHSWCRPRTLESVMTHLGLHVPQRLRTSRFQAVVNFLKESGIELCLAKDPDQTVLTDDESSPGIAARVLLRLAQEEDEEPSEDGTSADDVEPEEEDSDEDDDADDEDDGDEDEEVDAEDALPSALRNIGLGWSQPQAISSLLRAFGEEVPMRLRTERFQSLVASLHAVGIEACLADDEECTPLEQDAESPGRRAELRLRRRQDSSQPQGSRRAPISPPVELKPTKVIVVPEQPVTQKAPRPSDYQLAVVRLQFLTAVPSVERRTMPAWPRGYLDAATRDLSLRPQELMFLAALATGLCIGNHSPVDPISQLELALTREEWDTLAADFRALNPFQPELVGAILEQVSQFGSWPSRGAWQSASPPSSRGDTPTPAAARRSAVSLDESLRPALLPKAAVPSEGSETKNVRSLGALDDMFDEE